MYLHKEMCRRISAALAAVMILGNPVIAQAAPARDRGGAKTAATVETAGYRAEVDLASGTVLLSCNSDHTKDWNTTDGMSPGATMFLDSNDQVRPADMTVDGVFASEDGNGGAVGIRMSGEVTGVKSWFLFDNEIGRASCRERV